MRQMRVRERLTVDVGYNQKQKQNAKEKNTASTLKVKTQPLQNLCLRQKQCYLNLLVCALIYW